MITLTLSRCPLETRGGLIEVLHELVDPRHKRGIRHSFVSIMAIAVCATLAGAASVPGAAAGAGPRALGHRKPR
jgi:DDE_Tnp_1-associated